MKSSFTVLFIVLALVPPAVVTLTSTAPAAPAGERSVIVSAVLLRNALAGTTAPTPKFTDVALARFVPEIVISLPPAKGATRGKMVVMAGAGACTVMLAVLFTAGLVVTASRASMTLKT